MSVQEEHEVDVVIVGAGFAGMYMLHRMRGLGVSVKVFEAGSDVGGTWYWNRYPGARCDVESMEYSYQFDEALQQEWAWTERYAGQPEILNYASHVADRFELRNDITFDTKVTGAVFDESTSRWTVTTDGGHVVDTQFLVMATGCLSSANTPAFDGIDSFQGGKYHTGQWPHAGVDFEGKRVAVIGTGSSAIQSIPIIANECAHLTVFQRTANYTIPAQNRPLTDAEQHGVKTNYAGFRAANNLMPGGFGSAWKIGQQSALEVDADTRKAEFDERWESGGFAFLAAYNDFILNKDANDTAAQYVRDRIAEIVHDPATAELLSPHQVIGCKRICIDSGFYETFNRPNVELVDVGTHPIERITPTGVLANGVDYAVDCIVFATGFDAMTGTLLKVDIRGRSGLTLRDAWHAGPRTYLGLGVVGFPNLFTVSGPGSPSVLTNMIVSIEQHVNWITDAIAFVRDSLHHTIEATQPAQDEWVDYVNAVADMTLYPSCNSWYLGANIPGKTRVFMPLIGLPPYVDKCNDVAAKGYEGFVLA